MFGTKKSYHHKLFQKVNQDIHTFAKKNEHFNKIKPVLNQSKASEEPQKSAVEK